MKSKKEVKPEDKPSGKRCMISMEITPKALEGVQEISRRTGMIQKELVGRVLEWFYELPHIERQIILGQFDSDDKVLFSDLLIRRRIAELVADDRIAYFSGMNVALNLLSQLQGPLNHPVDPQARKAQG